MLVPPRRTWQLSGEMDKMKTAVDDCALDFTDTLEEFEVRRRRKKKKKTTNFLQISKFLFLSFFVALVIQTPFTYFVNISRSFLHLLPFIRG